MSDGVDGGGGENEVDSHSSTHAETGESTNHREDESLDPDSEAALNTNYDSSDGAVPAFRYVCTISTKLPFILHISFIILNSIFQM